MITGSAHAELCNGLSRMKGNFQVRFLGEGAAAMPLSYPTKWPEKSASLAGMKTNQSVTLCISLGNNCVLCGIPSDLC